MAVVATAGLTAAIAAGDETAFGAFYDAWFAAALSMARALSRRDEDFGLDVVQEVMLEVVHKIPRLDSEAAVQSWMARVVANKVVDRLRREQRRAARERVAASAAATSTIDSLAALLAGEEVEWLQARLCELPSIDRELVQARFGGAISVTATAASFGLGADAAHGRLRRVLARLRRAAKEWFDD